MCAHASRKVHPRESLASARDRKGSRIRRGKMYLLCDDVECADKAKVNALPYGPRDINSCYSYVSPRYPVWWLPGVETKRGKWHSAGAPIISSEQDRDTAPRPSELGAWFLIGYTLPLMLSVFMISNDSHLIHGNSWYFHTWKNLLRSFPTHDRACDGSVRRASMHIGYLIRPPRIVMANGIFIITR